MSKQQTRKEAIKQTAENAREVKSTAEALLNRFGKMTDEEWERWGREHNSDLEFTLQEAINKINTSIITVDMLKNIRGVMEDPNTLKSVRELTKDPYKG
jgi:hypothetical protein